MRRIRILLITTIAIGAFAACKKGGGGYMTEPTVSVASGE
jgi:hypothetical protein